MLALALTFLTRNMVGIIAGTVLTGLVGGAFHWVDSKIQYHRGHTAGWNDAVAEVRRVDVVAAGKANEARSRVDACFDQDGEWDAARAVCVGANPDAVNGGKK